MNRARPPSQRKQIACSGCHLTHDHSAATTRGVGVISPTRAVIRGTPSPLWLHYTENSGQQEMICSATALRWFARLGQARSVWSIWFVLFIWFIWLIRLVWFNQINKTNQTNQITVFLRLQAFSASG